MKKRLAAVVLASAMVFGSLAGCGSDGNSTAGSSSSETTGTSTSSTSASSTSASSETAEHGPSSEAAPAWDEYDALIDQIRVETDLAKREELMHQAEDMLMETWSVVPLYYYNDVYMQKTDVSGIYSNLFGFKYFAFAQAPNNTLALQIASEPDKLDPALNSTVDGGCLAILAFNGLYTYDEEGKLAPDLADSYTMSEDAMTYTFTMKDGLKWSDGEALDATDFVYSWNRLANPETGADYSYLADVIAKNDDGTLNISASEDGKTFTVVLNAPCAYFLDLCAFPAFYAVPQQNVESAEGAAENPGAWCVEAGFVTSGPFMLSEWKHNESMTYVPNPNYYAADKVSLEKIQFMLSSDDTAIFNAFQDGSLQFIDTIATDEMANVSSTPEFHKIDTLGTYYAGFNVNSDLFKGKTIEQAANMRKALSLLIDRQYIVDAIGQGGQEVATTFIPTGMADGNGGEFRANDDAYTYPDEENVGYYNGSSDADVMEAKRQEAIELLKSAGYEFDDAGMLSASTPITLTYLTNDSEGNVKIGEAIQQDFAAIGINLSVEQREWSVFLNERKDGQFDFCREGWLADYNDPINMLEMFTSDSGNNDMQLGK